MCRDCGKEWNDGDESPNSELSNSPTGANRTNEWCDGGKSLPLNVRNSHPSQYPMSDSDLINWVQTAEATVGPYLDERGGCAGWIAGCPSFVGWGRGDNWREAVKSLMEMMKNETTEDAKNRQGLAKASSKPTR